MIEFITVEGQENLPPPINDVPRFDVVLSKIVKVYGVFLHPQDEHVMDQATIDLIRAENGDDSVQSAQPR